MLKTCSKPDCQPLEQTRGDMGQGDYHDVIVNNRVERAGGVPDPKKYGIPIWANSNGYYECGEHNAVHCVEMDESGKTDFRICCKTCGKTTPWGYNDFPGMPGAGADYTRKKWNEQTENMKWP